MAMEAAKHPWEERVPALLFAGAIIGQQREILAEALAADVLQNPAVC